MDKYTVDLDKVLNDFEYSELTDQYNALSSNETAPQRNPDFYKYNNVPPKHNITKVFESLNEYLNSEIGNNPESSLSQSVCENPAPVCEELAPVCEKPTDIVSVTTEEPPEPLIIVPGPIVEEEVEEVKESQAIENEPELAVETIDVVEPVDDVKPAVGFDTAIDDSSLSEYLEELEMENPPTEEPVEPSRPCSLPVNSTVQIDLVGEPGSTPYNNVYVSDTLNKPESDPESSPTPSPTFSEASTESNGSTATTESIADGPPPDNTQVAEVVDVPNRTDEDGAEADDNLPTMSSTTLGKQAPVWIPDSDALSCLHCDTRFTVIKRRHHCRACGLVLCAKCSSKRYKLEYLSEEARVCVKCYDLLNKDTNSSSGSEGLSSTNSPNHPSVTPNPNNPMEYCSVVPPLQQVNASSQNPPTVMVPVGVLKRKGATKLRTNKSVIFCDGIRPGSELTNLDNDFNYNCKLVKFPHENKNNFVDGVTKSFIPHKEDDLPPIVNIYKSDVSYIPFDSAVHTVESLKKDKLTMAIHTNLYVHVKIVNMDCCINKWAWCFSTEGMINVGQDEILILLEYVDNEKCIPKDVLFHLDSIYNNAKTGSSITDYGISLHETNNFLDSKNHVGFLYIRPTFQCLQNVIVPNEMYLIGILIHRWEMPWAKIFPLRLILRLGAEYRYYPCPIVSTRHRESVFVEIGHTIINLLADFRNFSYTLPCIRGLTIHMEDKNTTVTIPLNRYDQVP
uniref:FYVE-type domain-containing protein n=1 Tax=Photinus pyralis TaxID=7054 RepID=A0A1Y1MFZ2_PHOPY